MAEDDHKKRFGKVMECEDAAGNDYGSAFAALSALSFDAGDEGGTAPQLRLVMRVWKDPQAYDDGKRPLPLSADGSGREYRFVGPTLDSVLGLTYNGLPVAKIITDIAWLIAQSTQDVLISPQSEDGETPAVFRSFFEGAKEVQ
jgi:hypothetical protein